MSMRFVLSRGVASLADWRASLNEIPGLGAYGARAVACFGFSEQVGLVDANVARVLRRLFALRQEDPRAVIFQKYADALANSSHDARALNYSLLDLGAEICMAKPSCLSCPLATCCAHAKMSRSSQRFSLRVRNRKRNRADRSEAMSLD